jgi:hypothetical protein
MYNKYINNLTSKMLTLNKKIIFACFTLMVGVAIQWAVFHKKDSAESVQKNEKIEPIIIDPKKILEPLPIFPPTPNISEIPQSKDKISDGDPAVMQGEGKENSLTTGSTSPPNKPTIITKQPAAPAGITLTILRQGLVCSSQDLFLVPADQSKAYEERSNYFAFSVSQTDNMIRIPAISLPGVIYLVQLDGTLCSSAIQRAGINSEEIGASSTTAQLSFLDQIPTSNEEVVERLRRAQKLQSFVSFNEYLRQQLIIRPLQQITGQLLFLQRLSDFDAEYKSWYPRYDF